MRDVSLNKTKKKKKTGAGALKFVENTTNIKPKKSSLDQPVMCFLLLLYQQKNKTIFIQSVSVGLLQQYHAPSMLEQTNRQPQPSYCTSKTQVLVRQAHAQHASHFTKRRRGQSHPLARGRRYALLRLASTFLPPPRSPSSPCTPRHRPPSLPSPPRPPTSIHSTLSSICKKVRLTSGSL